MEPPLARPSPRKSKVMRSAPMLFLNHIFHATLGILGILMVGWALAGLVSGNLAMISRRHTWLLNGPSLWLGALSLISMATGLLLSALRKYSIGVAFIWGSIPFWVVVLIIEFHQAGYL